MLDWLKNLWRPKAADPYAELQPLLVKLVESHGLEAGSYEHWVLPNNAFPALRAFAYEALEKPGFVSRQVDIELKLEDQRCLIDSYAGYGENLQAANAHAVYTFCIGAFHVYLSAFWNCHEPDQVDIATWTANGADWQVYCGNVITKASEGHSSHVAEGYYDAVKAYMTSLRLDSDLHWVSVFVSRLKDELTVQTQVDNVDCPDLDARMAALDWPASDGFYSARNFFLLKKA
ncbi:DUF6348 family protein [Asticcacaulis sp. AC402]|uniref:DUF6348 family protein n=1 Tax=Asticcacaulis sp. AC402 TaxID=1282361 RepID=UPI0003C3F9FA|nr:DUF6348 family protein [Asticcacaulis sp. AC402]ESQ74553.1 hypothetical protein ABAC402_13780 [Asticcacaulis sp. AC402]